MANRHDIATYGTRPEHEGSRMAGDWLKIEVCTPEKREVMAITLALGWDDPDLTVGKLFKMWRWFDQQTIEGDAASVTPALLDRIIGVDGFCAAVESVGWLAVNSDGITLPNFDRHNGQTAKQRALTAKRMSNQRKRKNSDAASVTSALPREEKRREEKNTHSAGAACAVETITSDDSPVTEQELAEAPPDGPDGIHGYGPVADFLEIWNSLPEGKRGVVRVGGLPARLPPFEERLFEQAWTRRKSDCIAAMAKIQAGGIGWDRSAVTVKEFFGTGMIDELLAGKHERRDPPPPEPIKARLTQAQLDGIARRRKEAENAATN